MSQNSEADMKALWYRVDDHGTQWNKGLLDIPANYFRIYEVIILSYKRLNMYITYIYTRPRDINIKWYLHQGSDSLRQMQR